MASKFYVVWAGRETGIFTNWAYTKKQVEKFPGARYKSFLTQAEAEAAFSSGRVSSTTSTKASSGSKSSEKKSSSVTSADAMNPFTVNIFCDGGCDPNPGKASSGVAVYRDGAIDSLWYGLFNPNGTNNSAELNALHQSLLIAQQEINNGNNVQVLCDSQYSINCVTVWAYSWKLKGWKRKVAGDIKNLEIIQQSHELYEQIKNRLTVSHVKAHIGVEGNELADRMSIYGIEQKETLFCQYNQSLDIKAILAMREG
ncbi:MAG: ribonuclease H family protein [Aliivibrio sp.]|uniref:ribonuclease H1 domain-containing protein n=1 Tax=Aliivibrio sp. TaxID=1872443 RepID=UPI001A4D4141|nr:ribonuclease H family protein [Aliivibrio sp.]